MDTISLPTRSAPLARIGFGCCPMGQHGWGRADEKKLIEAVNTALDNGIQFFDTADIYGLGKSEETLGKALRTRRKEAFIATKFGVRHKNGKTFYDNSRDWIRTSVTGSLQRLKCNCIDLYQLHYWDGTTPIDEIVDNLEELRDEGLILSYGFTNLNLADKGILNTNAGLASFSFEYSLANRMHEEVIRKNQEALDLLFLSWGSLGQGILSGKYTKKSLAELPPDDRRRRPTYIGFHGEALERNLKTVMKLKSIAAKYPGVTTSQTAIRWILDKIQNSIALVGIKDPQQLNEVLACLNWKLEQDDFRSLEQITSKEL